MGYACHMHPEPGHLFVVKGDLTKLACDGYVIPCDDKACVADYWQPLIPSLTEPCAWWLRVPGITLDGHFADVPNTPRNVVLVDTVSHSAVEDMVEAVVTAVRRCAADGELPRSVTSPRVMPLIGLPLPGTGEGVFPHVRGEVCQRLIERLTAMVAELPIDVALVLNDARDYAFAQGVRRDVLTEGNWGALGPRAGELIAEADRLGTAAGRGELSLFVGAGASIPLGLPSWETLVASLEKAVGGAGSGDLYVRAGQAREKNPSRYADELKGTFAVEQHAVVHALLANLNTGRVVTTNYDNALELALVGDHGHDTFRVMTRQVPDGGRPWLLKLHGDIADPETIVLTNDDYDRLRERSPALYGVVSTLMLTSTLVFVGFSLKDRDFKTVAEEVQQVLLQAQGPIDGGPGQSYGLSTPVALALAPEAVEVGNGVRAFVIGDEDDLEMSARRLEVMVDRMALRAAEFSATSAAYLLDDRYRVANADSAELIERLKSVAELVDGNRSGASAAWREVRKALVALGYSD